MAFRTQLTVAFVSLAVVLTGSAPAVAVGKPCKRPCTSGSTDTTAPTLSIGAPSAGATVAGTVTVSGSAADTSGVAAVDVSVDGGAWQRATGTGSWTWSWSTAGAANGAHSLSARATDVAGNSRSASVSVTVSNPVADTTAPSVSFSAPSSGATETGSATVSGSAADDRALSTVELRVDAGTWAPASGTSAWSWAWATTGVPDGTHTLTVRATDAAGNASTASRSVTVSNTASTPSPAPSTQGSWVSPEGVHINVSSAGPWTISGIYSMLKANALDLDRVGPSLTINVQDTQASSATTSAGQVGGRFTTYVATIWLQGPNSAFANNPDYGLAHEYGHAWSQYFRYIVHNGSWVQYTSARWTTSDGGLTLAIDARTDTAYTWTVNEIIADDYRLLLGSASAVSERPTHLNTTIPAPSSVPGLRDYLLGAFRTA